MSIAQDNKNWYALYTHSRCEFKVEEALKEKNIIVYLPVTKTVKKWSDRKKEITLPLFACYVFINATEKERLISLQHNQIVRCLTDAGKPAIIPNWQMENLKKMISSSPSVSVIEGLSVGEEIEIKSGPLKGVEGILLNIGNKKHLAISIKLLNRTILTYLPEEYIIRE